MPTDATMPLPNACLSSHCRQAQNSRTGNGNPWPGVSGGMTLMKSFHLQRMRWSCHRFSSCHKRDDNFRVSRWRL